MKKKVIGIIVVASMLIGTTVYAADSFYDNLKSEIDKKISRMDSNSIADANVQIEEYRDQEHQRVQEEVMAYFETNQDEIAANMTEGTDDYIEAEKKKIHEEANQKIKELKDYIDSLAE